MSKKKHNNIVQQTIEVPVESSREQGRLPNVLHSIRNRVVGNISHQFWYHHIDRYKGLRDCNGQLIDSQSLDKP